MWQYVECLKHEPYRSAPQPRALIIGETTECLTFDGDTSLIRYVETRDQIEQSRFSGAGFAHDGDEFALRKRELQSRKQCAAARNCLSQSADLE